MKERLLHIIAEEPQLCLGENHGFIHELTHEKLIINFSKNRLEKWASILVFIYILLLTLMVLLIDDTNYTMGIYDYLAFVGSVGGVLFVMYLGFFMPKRNWIFDRRNQQITIPHLLLYKHKTIHVHDLSFVKYNNELVDILAPFRVGFSWVIYNLDQKLPDLSVLPLWKSLTALKLPQSNLWSFFIWYLDKNRPLPPGKVFDQYREEDFQRRRRAGFPAPLFYSLIATPEITAEQQAERNRYWKDEDFMARPERYRDPKQWGTVSEDNKVIPLNIEEGATVVIVSNNPHDWERQSYTLFENFNYLKTPYAMRYEFDDGRVYYAFIDQNTKEVYAPAKGDVCKKEIIR